MLYYLPSCNFTAAHKETSAVIRKYLQEKHNAETGACCRIMKNRLQPGDEVLQNCQNCTWIMQENRPDIPQASLYEFLLEDVAFPWPDYHGERITVQDCLRAAGKPAEQQAIRTMLERMNMVPVELAENRENTRFCGTWRYEPVSPANRRDEPQRCAWVDERGWITPAAPQEKQRIMQEWVKQYETDRVAVYCNSCLKGVLLGGADGVHVLDLAFAGMMK